MKDIIANPYNNYIYSYPHKKAYREFPHPINLKTLWANSNSQNITLYIHFPFCMNKCGYCNLFSTTHFDKIKISKYVDKIIEELQAVKEFLNIKNSIAPFKNVIFGGGTPTILDETDLKRLLEATSEILNIDFTNTFFAIETSPRTINKSKLELLKQYNINRISMGVQSSKENELKSIYRFEPLNEIDSALNLIFKEEIPIRNLDLIYGIPNQTLKTWEDSLNSVLKYRPEEIYIYPLYIREKTGLHSKYERNLDLMLDMYAFGRDLLKENNYIQTSMRNFIRKDRENKLFPEYSCQENEMIGLGCGARSYISNVHYSRKYAVLQKNTNRIIEDYLNEKDFNYATYGYILNQDELKRRYVLKSILKITGLDINDYNNKFGRLPMEDFKEILFLKEQGFLEEKENRIYPTEKGLMFSDAIGNIFISDEVKFGINEFIE